MRYKVVTKNAVVAVVVVVMSAISFVAKADLTETRTKLNQNVISPLQTELDAVVKSNKELATWNEAHKGTLEKLNKIVSVMNEKWIDNNDVANKGRDVRMREALKALWDLEDQKAIGTLADLEAFVVELMNAQIPGRVNENQFSDRTRSTYFDKLILGKIKELKEASKEDPITKMRREMASVPFRTDSAGIGFPTITKKNDTYQATEPKKLNTDRVQSLEGILGSARKLDKALQACPTPQYVAEQLAKIAKLEQANQAEHTRVDGLVAKEGTDFTAAVDKLSDTKLKSEVKAQSDRDANTLKYVRSLISEAIDFSVVPFVGDKVAVGMKSLTSDEAKQALIDTMVKDVMTESFAKEGHGKLMETFKTMAKSPISTDDPAPFKDFSGLTKSSDIASEVLKDGQATIQVTKLNVKLAETLPGDIASAISKAKDEYQAAMKKASDTFSMGKSNLEANKTRNLGALQKAKEEAQIVTDRLTADRASVTACQMKLPKVVERIHAFDSTVQAADLDAATHDVEEATRKSDVPSLQKK